MKQGHLLNDRFEVSECVGRGSCGAVFRAWDRVLEREVAIKRLDRAIDERVMRTSRAAARLNHPSIVPLFEVGEADGFAFLVSEYIDGLTLRQAQDRGLLTDRDVAEIGAELYTALHHAHERGVLHGDIKPENVIVRTRAENPDQRSGRCLAKLRDFATREIAGVAEDEGAYLTPEQADGSDTGPASDVYGIALILFECWTGRNPLAEATGPVMGRIRGRQIPSLADLRPDLPTRLSELVDSALDQDPKLRPPALELCEWLDHAFDELDYELAVPELAPPPERPRVTAKLGVMATVALAPVVALAGFAPAVFALASWPGRASARLKLGVVSAAAVLAATALFDPSAAPIALANGSTGLGGLLTPYAALLVVLWGAAALALGGLARAASPLSGAALGAAFSLAALVLTELLERASEAADLTPLGPIALVAVGSAAAAIMVSRRAAAMSRSLPAAGPLPEDEAADLLPPEPEDSELRITVTAGGLVAANVPNHN